MIDHIILMIIKSSLVLLTAYLVGNLFFSDSAVNRNYIYRMGFLSVLLLPLFSIAMPQWDLMLLNIFPSLDNSISGTITTTKISFIDLSGESIGRIRWMIIIFIGWVLGFCLFLSRNIIGQYQTYTINKNALALKDFVLVDIISSVKHDFKIRQAVIVKISEHTSVPFVTGFYKPTIILPSAFNSWNKEKQKMVLTHEIAHIKRKDALWLLLSSIISVFYWFNPLVWLCRNKMIIDTEIACDNYVLSVGYDAQVYAGHLLNIAKNITYNLFISPVNVNMARKTQLEGRLMAILKNQKRTLKVTPALSIIGIIVTIAFLLPLSGMQLFAGDTDNQPVTISQQLNSENSAAKDDDEGYPKPDEFVKLKVMPEMIKMHNPEYPEKLKKKGFEGEVFIKALVKKDGTIHKAITLKTSGHNELDQAAIDAALKNIFTPGLDSKDKPVACWVSYKVTFQLDDKEIKK